MSKTNALLMMCIGALLSAAPARAQDTLIDSSKVRLEQRLNEQAPLDTVFRDDTGKTVRLGDYFGKKPILLMLPFYKCPGICKDELMGIVRSLKQINFNVGNEFDVVIVSINPKETPDIAALHKEQYVKDYQRPDTAHGWHLLTGEEAQIRRLADAVGFYYVYDTKTDQYNHPAGLMVLTPQGKLSRYFYGVQYDPRTLKLALIEASQNKIGTLAERILMYCSAYDPTRGRYGLVIMRVLQLAGLATLLILGTSIFIMIRLERRRARIRAARATG